MRGSRQPYLRSEFWWAHPKNVLVTLLCSDDTEHRVFAVDTIMTLRAGSEHGSSGLPSFKVPVNLDDCHLT